MKRGRCPKCQAPEIHIVPGNRFEPDIPTGSFSKAFLSAYVCVRCGYVEMYVEDESELPKIAARWIKVGGEE